MRKTSAETHHILVKIYSEHAIAEQMRPKWFARFTISVFGLEDEELVLGDQNSQKRPISHFKSKAEEAIILHHDNARSHVARTSIQNWLD